MPRLSQRADPMTGSTRSPGSITPHAGRVARHCVTHEDRGYGFGARRWRRPRMTESCVLMPAIKPDRVLGDLYKLREFGAYKTGVHRPTLSADDVAARQWFAE